MTRRRRLALAVVSLWLGAMILLAGTVANTVFIVVGQEAGGRIMQRIFPYFYAGSLICPAAALALLLSEGLRAARRRAALAPLVLSLVVAAWNAFVLGPRISATRAAMHAAVGDAQAPLVKSFGALHKQSVAAMGALMLLALIYLLIEVLAPARSGQAGPGPARK